jgi:hypothetical protein
MSKRCRVAVRALVALLFVAGTLLPAALRPQPAIAATTPCHAGSAVSVYDLEILAGDSAGPVVSDYETAPMVVSETGLACYGGRELRVVAFVRFPQPMGWEYTFGLKPGWFRSSEGLFVSSASGTAPPDEPVIALAVPPALGNLQAKYEGRWVTVTGHFDDPTAATCTATGEPGVAPSAADAVLICRSTFVVASVAPATAPSTSSADLPVALTTSWGSAWLAGSAAFGGVAALWYTGRRRRR